MMIQFGTNPIAWANDDDQTIGADIPTARILDEAGRQIGFDGIENGHRWPDEPEALRALLAEYGLKFISGWYSTELLVRSVADEIVACQAHLAKLKHNGCKVCIACETSNSVQGLAKPLSARPVLDSAGMADFAARVVAAVDKRLETLERRAIAGASWRDFGAVILCRDLAEAAVLSNRVAPEHLELCVADPDALAAEITHAGAIFLGAWTPEAIGDYVGGPNHVLPTARSARFSSGLSVLDFVKRTTLAKMTPEALAAIGQAAERLARSESLEAHGLSVTARLAKVNKPI